MTPQDRVAAAVEHVRASAEFRALRDERAAAGQALTADDLADLVRKVRERGGLGGGTAIYG